MNEVRFHYAPPLPRTAAPTPVPAFPARSHSSAPPAPPAPPVPAMAQTTMTSVATAVTTEDAMDAVRTLLQMQQVVPTALAAPVRIPMQVSPLPPVATTLPRMMFEPPNTGARPVCFRVQGLPTICYQRKPVGEFSITAYYAMVDETVEPKEVCTSFDNFLVRLDHILISNPQTGVYERAVPPIHPRPHVVERVFEDGVATFDERDLMFSDLCVMKLVFRIFEYRSNAESSSRRPFKLCHELWAVPELMHVKSIRLFTSIKHVWPTNLTDTGELYVRPEDDVMCVPGISGAYGQRFKEYVDGNIRLQTLRDLANFPMEDRERMRRLEEAIVDGHAKGMMSPPGKLREFLTKCREVVQLYDSGAMDGKTSVPVFPMWLRPL